jgi:NACalpha-BTF3-like transcription factor
MQFDEVLRTFAAFFERENIPYAVIGGLAMQAWGSSRFTKDVDFVVPRAHREHVVAFAESAGYETLHVSASHSNHLHAEKQFGRVDVMYVDDATAARIFAGAEPRAIVGTVELPVARPEHLAMMKGLAMKADQDRVRFEAEDVRLLINLAGVDREAVREYFRRHGMLDLYNAIERAR